jgi:hypothetical protein
MRQKLCDTDGRKARILGVWHGYMREEIGKKKGSVWRPEKKVDDGMEVGRKKLMATPKSRDR